MDTVSQIIDLIKKKGITEQKFLLDLGLNKSVISDWRKGTTTSYIRHIQKIADYLNVSVDYLLGRDERPLPPNVDAIQFDYGNMVRIPIIGEVHAGNGGYAQESIEGYQLVDCDDLKGCPVKEFFFLRIKGDSMTPDLQEGDLVLIHKQTSVDNGDIGVFLIDDEEPLIKRVKYKENYIELLSFNPFYSPRVFVGRDVTRVYVIGKVKQSVRRW